MTQLGRPGLSLERKAEFWKRWKAGESLSEIARALKKGEEISRGLAAGLSQRQIAAPIGPPPSSVSREISTNGGESGYRARESDEKAWDRARRPKKCLFATSHKLRTIVAKKLQMQSSPQQISGWLKTSFTKSPELQITHETIYRTQRTPLGKVVTGYVSATN